MEARIAAKLVGSVLGMFVFWRISRRKYTIRGIQFSGAVGHSKCGRRRVPLNRTPNGSSSIVNRPTFFAFARGAAVMGEAGRGYTAASSGTDGKLGDLWQRVPERDGDICTAVSQSATRGRNDARALKAV
ncbi:phage tail tape measure protein [Salmonella enterica subsp. enterica]|nr:phage tail tape measure protein [Salmonella enterica subsp. enterica]